MLESGKKWVFGATFANYAFAHWTRKCYTNVKPQFIAAGIDPLTLTAMDSGFMFTYAGGSFVTGMLGDRFSPVAVIALGLLGSTICLFLMLFGASPVITSNAGLCGAWFLSVQVLLLCFSPHTPSISTYFNPLPSYLPTALPWANAGYWWTCEHCHNG